MAIVKCENCDHYFGEKKRSCPKCATPNIANKKTREKPVTEEELKIDRDAKSFVIISIFVGIAGGIIYFLIFS